MDKNIKKEIKIITRELKKEKKEQKKIIKSTYRAFMLSDYPTADGYRYINAEVELKKINGVLDCLKDEAYAVQAYAYLQNFHKEREKALEIDRTNLKIKEEEQEQQDVKENKNENLFNKQMNKHRNNDRDKGASTLSM